MWRAPPSASESDLAARLAASAHERVEQANDPSRLGTALGWLARFQAAMPHRTFLMARGGADDASAAAYNAHSFSLLAEFIRLHGSVRPGSRGTTVRGETIDGYISTLKMHISVMQNARVTDATRDLQRPRQMKSMRLDDAPSGTRKKRVGLRARHLREAARRGLDRLSPLGLMHWCVALTAWSALLRGGELGVTKRTYAFNWRRGITWVSVEWLTPRDTGTPFYAVVMWIVPIKDATGKAKRHPILVRALEPGEPSPDLRHADPLCLYCHLRELWRRRAHLVPDGARAHTPLFALPARDGGERPWCTDDVRALAVEVSASAGEDTADTGAHMFRIGGATDVRDRFGPVAGKVLINDRGRWADDDIGFIYQRVTADEQLRVSAEMTRADARDLERVFASWAQPARRR